MYRHILKFAFALVAMMTAVVVEIPSAHAQGACPFSYVPVCGLAPIGIRITYSNACWAKLGGAKVLHPGECLGPICTKDIKPVCAIDPATGRRKTYSNLCVSENANARWLHNGACRRR
jgi:hypothetical protein